MAFNFVLPELERIERDLESEQAPAVAGSRDREEKLAAAMLKGAAAKRDPLRNWLRRCEAGLAPAAETAQELTKSMLNAGPSLYDGVVTYEHLALPFLEKVDKSAGTLPGLSLVYPRPLLVARHPALLFGAAPEQQEAARNWLRFLLSQEMQEKALALGFRPARPEVALLGDSAQQNRFQSLRRYGVLIEPQWREAPRVRGGVVQELMALWREATGR